MSPRPRRAVLFLPASNPRAIARARTLPVDTIILDLEDAVGPDDKVPAREAATAAARNDWGGRELVVRVNAPDTEWGVADLLALAAAPPDAVLVPKVDRAADLAAVAAALPGVPLWAMIETPLAALRPDGIAGAAGLAALVIGPNDLARSLGCTPGADRLPLLPFLTATVAAARAHGLAAIDGVYNAIDDAAGFAAEAAQGARLGFDGKTLIHPSQVDPALAAFSPTGEQVAAARAVVRAFAAPEAAGRGAIRHEGRMIERLHLAEAERTLARAAQRP